MLFFLSPFQRRVHLDQPAGGGGGAVWLRAGGSGFGSSGYQRGPGGTLLDRGCGGGGGSWSYPHQLPRRETTDAPPGQFPGRSAGPHLRGLQHVTRMVMEVKLVKITNT